MPAKHIGTMREDTYKIEEMILAPYAAFSRLTKGRLKPVEPCPLRTDYQRDRDRILHSKSFRRLKHKTQVFIAPEGDHFRTRLTHTLEVSQIARTIARALRLNEDLAEAISLGHDLGHTPFGHTGERVLKRLTGGAFSHNAQSLRVVDILENDGEGLNLTFEVRDGIINHRLTGSPATYEGSVVCLADKIAYVNHDIDDAVSAGLIMPEDLPAAAVKRLGATKSDRIASLVLDVVSNSGEAGVRMSEESYAALLEIRDFLFENVYARKFTAQEETTAELIVTTLFEKYLKNPDELPPFFRSLLNKYPPETVAADFVAGMTDVYAIRDSNINIKSRY